ncbi:MAG: phage tail protein [Oceanospirillaceae bacterium]|nr:phage tail protein [Oceanospirillaceae bacterium]
MAEPYYGEIKMIALTFAPRDWAFCDGQEMQISQNTELFSLLGTAYGGNGTTNFHLPDMRGRVPIHKGSDGMGSYYERGWYGGQEEVVLNSSNIQRHTHELMATESVGNQDGVFFNSDAVFAESSGLPLYTAVDSSITSLASGTCSAVGADQAHSNLQPSIAINFVIALQGTYPSRN